MDKIENIKMGIKRLADDIEETLEYDPESLLPEDVPKKEVIRAFNEQISEAYDFANNNAKDNFLDQCLLYLAIRIIELRSRITNFKSEDDHKAI